MHSKLIGCRIYGSIRVSPTALKIIDTKEFQRMRNIKQLALCYYVYPAATNTRFEHSIGVYHLAGKILDKIQQQYPNRLYHLTELGTEPIGLSAKIVECIKIAALCHDIGHGPYSHIFDDVLLEKSVHPNKCHEVRSCQIVDMLCRRELGTELTDQDINFIKSIINPQSQHTGALYQIVSNYLNGIDVDKFDYLTRDAVTLGLTVVFNPDRLINEFIIDQNGNIAYPKHCSTDIYEMFHCRYMMHKKVYSHKTVKILELMLKDLFMEIDPIFNISSRIEHMDKFCDLTDDTIFHYIRTMTEVSDLYTINLTRQQRQHIVNANNIYQNILSRNIYVQVVELADADGIYLKQLLAALQNAEFNPADFSINKTSYGFNSGHFANPFDSIYFYHKIEDDRTFIIDKHHFSAFVNSETQESYWRLVCKNRSVVPSVEQFIKSYNKI